MLIETWRERLFWHFILYATLMAVQNGFCYIFLVPRMNEWENTEVGELSMGM